MIVDESLREFSDRARKPFPPPTASTRKCRRAVAIHGAVPSWRPAPPDPRAGRLAVLAKFVRWILSEASRVAYVDVPASKPFRHPNADPKTLHDERSRNLFWSSGAGLTRSERDRAQAKFLRDHPNFAAFYRIASWRGQKIRHRLVA